MLTQAGLRLRARRETLGLTIRDVEKQSDAIARHHATEEFAIPLSRLSDIETKGIVPNVYRMHSLALIYQLSFREIASWYGVPLDEDTADIGLRSAPKLHVRQSTIGDIIDDRFRLDTKLGEGSLASGWRGWDTITNSPVLVKVFFDDDSSTEVVRQYLAYLETVSAKLRGTFLPDVSVPIATGQTKDNIRYQVIPWVDVAETLQTAIRKSGPLLPSKALQILSNIGKALSHLHNRSILHGDLKPSNVFLMREDEVDVMLADLGMVRVDADGTALVLSTPRYMHPGLLAEHDHLTTGRQSSASRRAVRLTDIGTYIDLYALGVITIEMLTGSAHVPRPLTKLQLTATLQQTNKWIGRCDSDLVYKLSDLVLRMLGTGPGTGGVTAGDISSDARILSVSLLTQEGREPTHETGRSHPERLPEMADEPDEAISAITEIHLAVQKLDVISERLASQTAAFVTEDGSLRALPNAQEDERVINDVRSMLDNALRRTQTTWKVGMVMTVAAFILIFGMVTSAVVLSILTGESRWALIFGGVGVSGVIGTLIWRPFDRIFRATIQSQQIEMIHVQIVTGFRGTADPKERARICKDAITGLQTLYRQTAPRQELTKA